MSIDTLMRIERATLTWGDALARYARIPLAVVAGALLCASVAGAQSTEPDPWEQARWRFGPLAVTPSVQLQNLGVDTNVFNEVNDPKKDFTTTIAPGAGWWLRLGPTRLVGTDLVQGVYYAKYASERSINNFHQVTFEYPLTRIRPYAGGSYVNTKDRPGYEIDKRARHTEWATRAGAAIRATAKTTFDLSASQIDYTFDGDATFQGTYLSEILNRQAKALTGQIRYKLTPLTTLTLSAAIERERFDESPERDNNGFRLLPGVELASRALITGKAQVGYRQLNMLSPAIPDFEGVVAAVSLGYLLAGATRFAVGVDRDVQYSYEIDQPYYVLTGVTGSITRIVGLGWDVVVRGANQRLAYRDTANVPESAAGRVDRVVSWGGGVGYRLSQGARVGFNADYYSRRSPIYERTYEGLRAGLAVTYDF